MKPEDCCQKHSSINDFTTDVMTSKFESFSKSKNNNLYLTESMQTDWLHMLDDYLNEKDTPYSDGFDFWPDTLYQYFNVIPLGEATESAYFMWNSEQHRLAPKYDILCSFVTRVKHCFVNMEKDGNQLKITCQWCNGFTTCKGRSGELLYINFLCAEFSTIGPYPEEIGPLPGRD